MYTLEAQNHNLIGGLIVVFKISHCLDKWMVLSLFVSYEKKVDASLDLCRWIEVKIKMVVRGGGVVVPIVHYDEVAIDWSNGVWLVFGKKKIYTVQQQSRACNSSF